MTAPGDFQILAEDKGSSARLGVLQTAHGPVETPVFMPVGTQGTVKGLSPAELHELNVPILLGNTYHLNIRPGMDIMDEVGGLHRFMGWDKPILTDSGGFQVFSLADSRKIKESGVEFRSHVDGAKIFLGPVEAMAIQRRLGSDIAMVFDECPPYPCDRHYACQSMELTLRWAALSAEQPRADGQLVFGIVQGSSYAELRARCARELVAMSFDGYAIGGVSVGEPEAFMMQAIDDCIGELPTEKPRYLMGVGKMHQMLEAVSRGVDMFDCVMPTRFARNGAAFTRRGRFSIKAGEWKADTRPIDESCSCYTCRNFSRAYVRHLLNVNEMLGPRLVTVHNIHTYMTFMQNMRDAIRNGSFDEFRRAFESDYTEILV